MHFQCFPDSFYHAQSWPCGTLSGHVVSYRHRNAAQYPGNLEVCASPRTASIQIWASTYFKVTTLRSSRIYLISFERFPTFLSNSYNMISNLLDLFPTLTSDLNYLSILIILFKRKIIYSKSVALFSLSSFRLLTDLV